MLLIGRVEPLKGLVLVTQVAIQAGNFERRHVTDLGFASSKP